MAQLRISTAGRCYTTCTKNLIDEEEYRAFVLRAPPDLTEDELDHRLELEARVLGLECRPVSGDPLPSSNSATTFASDSEQPQSAISQSTDHTSCSSSERHYTNQPLVKNPRPISSTFSVTPSLYSYTEQKASAIRNGFRKMSMFRKRRSGISNIATTSTSTEARLEGPGAADQRLTMESLGSQTSPTSGKRSWSIRVSPTNNATDQDSVADDSEAAERTENCIELQELQSRHREERDRFWEYQRKCLTNLRSEYETSKKQKFEAHTAATAEKKAKTETSLTDLEHRHLSAEIKLISELDTEKRTCIIRLRHMEAYCHSPSSSRPQTCLASNPESRFSSSLDSHPPHQPSPPPPTVPLYPKYHRKVTEKDFHNLAQQYHSRDTMQSLHRSRIEVLRGRQQKQTEDYLAKKTQEIRAMEDAHREEMKKLDEEQTADEQALRTAFREKGESLNRRWSLEIRIERAKQEKVTGLPFALPPHTISVAD